MGLDDQNSLTKLTKLRLSEQRIVGMFTGYFFVSALVEYQNGERHIVAWGDDS